MSVLRLWNQTMEKRENANSLMATDVNFNQSQLSPISSPMHLFKTKKGEGLFCFCIAYGRFLRTKIMTMPITATKTNSPAIAGTKYMSAAE